MYKIINHLKKDPKLANIINQVGNCKLKINHNRFEVLLESIITQQLSNSAAKSISLRFRQLYSGKFPTPSQVKNTSSYKLQKTGLSKMKVSYMKEISQKIDTNELDLDLLSKKPDYEIINELTKIKGIGLWTAQMFLIFALGRTDVLPTTDLGVKKGFQKMYSMKELPTEKKMLHLSKKWKPYRTIATWYLWKSLQKFETIG